MEANSPAQQEFIVETNSVSNVRMPLPLPTVTRVESSARDNDNKEGASRPTQGASLEKPAIPTGATDTMGNKLNVYA